MCMCKGLISDSDFSLLLCGSNHDEEVHLYSVHIQKSWRVNFSVPVHKRELFSHSPRMELSFWKTNQRKRTDWGGLWRYIRNGENIGKLEKSFFLVFFFHLLVVWYDWRGSKKCRKKKKKFSLPISRFVSSTTKRRKCSFDRKYYYELILVPFLHESRRRRFSHERGEAF